MNYFAIPLTTDSASYCRRMMNQVSASLCRGDDDGGGVAPLLDSFLVAVVVVAAVVVTLLLAAAAEFVNWR